MSEQSLRGQLKLYLIDYFDGIKFEIDIQAQKSIEKLKYWPKMREDVLKINLNMVDKVKEIYENNSKAVDDYFNSRDQIETKDLEELKSIIFNGFCVLFNKEDHFWYYEDDIFIGLLIVTDWYLDQNQLDYLRCLFFIIFEYLKKYKLIKSTFSDIGDLHFIIAIKCQKIL
jgi:hypothetical protein